MRSRRARRTAVASEQHASEGVCGSVSEATQEAKENTAEASLRERAADEPSPAENRGSREKEVRMADGEKSGVASLGEHPPPHHEMSVSGMPNPPSGAARPKRALLLFAGRRRAGSMAEAWRALGYQADDVDVLVGGQTHDVRKPAVQSAILTAVRAGCYEVVWIGTPCSSFSVLHLEKGRPRLRSRQEPDGVREMPPRWKRYVGKHNEFVRFSAEVARAAWAAGATYVLENPVDRGLRGSPHYSHRLRRHVPLWLMPDIRELARETSPCWVSFPMCAFGGPFQKWTTLMAGGARARRVRALGGCLCSHAQHERRARGTSSSGRTEASVAGEYPTLFNASMAWILCGAGKERAVDGEGLRHALVSEAARDLERAVGKSAGRWRAAPERMPIAWEEREDVLAGRADGERTADLKFISRRRADKERDEVLAKEELPSRGKPPRIEAQPPRQRVDWPRGAPAPPIRISQLFHPGVYEEVQERIRDAASGVREAAANLAEGKEQGRIPKVSTKTFSAQICQPGWARECIWDTSDPENCVPLQPFSEEEPPVQAIVRSFFAEWGEKLSWTDADMLRQVRVTGCESRSTCSRDTVIYCHHKGLREHLGPAQASIDRDTTKGWMTEGRPHLWTVPARVVPKNVVDQQKWKLVDGVLTEVTKWRVTTDDSIAGGEGDCSRNQGIDRDSISNVSLPTIRQLARAAAVVKAVSARAAVGLSKSDVNRVALWALDLSDAYRMVACARHEWWLQQFIWLDGVRLDKRCEFGTAHLVDLFERVTTFVLAVAKHRIRLYDERVPYGSGRRAWQEDRCDEGLSEECSYQDVYLDDIFGLTCLESDEALRHEEATTMRVVAAVEARRDGSVHLFLAVGGTRAGVHMSITRGTFGQAGWEVAEDKVQDGEKLNLLGIGVSVEGEGSLHVPEVKRQGLSAEIDAQLGRIDRGEEVGRKGVERLVGRLSHIAQVVAEGKAYLHPLYRLERASFRVRPKGSRSRRKGGAKKIIVKPKTFRVDGATPTARGYRLSLQWWKAALAVDTSVVLAPRLAFPEIGEPGCAFVFTDAAREDGTGYGGFTVWQQEGETASMGYISERWDEESLQRLQRDDWSMPAGEMFGATMIISACLRRLEGVTHLVCFTDSKATARALTTGGSGAPQINRLAQFLQSSFPRVQILGVHQPGKRNGASDSLSRGRGEAVVEEARAAGLSVERLELPASAADLLRDSQSQCLREAE